jgi:hypothetical protein
VNKQFAKFIREKDVDFARWTDSLNQLSEFNAGDFSKDFTTMQFSNLIDEVVKTLGEISEIGFKSGTFKDTFDNSQMYLHRVGPSLIIKSNKTATAFYLDADDEGISLRTHLHPIHNMDQVGDDFWLELLSLQNMGMFKLNEHEHYGDQIQKKYGTAFKKRKSIIFRLMRNYFVGLRDNESGIVNVELKVTWTPDYSLHDILLNYCEAFKILYNLNYQLWKCGEKNKNS